MSPDRRDAGMVTAELAVSLFVLMLVVAFAVSAVGIVDRQARVQDTAAEVARAVARGDRTNAAQIVQRQAPGATWTAAPAGGLVVISIRERAHPFSHWLPSVTLSARAVALVEPGRGG